MNWYLFPIAGFYILTAFKSLPNKPLAVSYVLLALWCICMSMVE